VKAAGRYTQEADLKLQLDADRGQYQIRSYTRDAVIVNDQVLRQSFVVMPDTLISDWPPQRFDELLSSHFEKIAALQPELVILGSGRMTRFPKSALIAPLIAQRIGFESMDTASACRAYSVLVAEGRRVAAAILIIDADD
jgi:uncharacterized protein